MGDTIVECDGLKIYSAQDFFKYLGYDNKNRVLRCVTMRKNIPRNIDIHL